MTKKRLEKIFITGNSQKALITLRIALCTMDFIGTIIKPFTNKQFVLSILIISSIGIYVFADIIFAVWFVHPFFSGYERVYLMVVNWIIHPNKDVFDKHLTHLQNVTNRYFTYFIQYSMKFFDRCANQINEIVFFINCSIN